MQVPTISTIEANKDNQEVLARWYRFCTVNEPEELEAMNLICKYFKGFTPELSKLIGW